GSGTAWGSLFVSGSPAWDEQGQGECAGARFITASGDTCVRWVGLAERVIGRVVSAATRAAASTPPGGQEDGWSLCEELAPVHWFSGDRTGRAPRRGPVVP